MHKSKLFIKTIFILVLLLMPQVASAVNVEFSGFGDMTYAETWGGPADEADGDLFFGTPTNGGPHGTDAHPLSQNNGFGNTGVDFVILAELNDRLSMLSEINIQLERGGTSGVGLDLERTYLDYRINNGFNIQVGSFFTPIGFHGRTLYSRAWLMFSVQTPDFDEEELGLVPNHSTGIHLYGNIPTMGAHSLNYAISVGNARGPDPVTLILNRDDGDRKTVTGLLEWVFPSHRDFRIGLSGWAAKLDTVLVGPNYGDTATLGVDPDVELDELGFNPYLVLYGERFNFILEYVTSRHEDSLGNLGGAGFDFEAVFAELSLNLMEDTVHPYIRYDFTDLPDENGGPYLPLRDDGGTLTRHFIPEFEALIVGVAYDLFALNRIKVELVHHLDGAREDYGLNFQTAFAF
jgi:hypothetical protein